MAHECTASTSGSSAVATSSGEGDRDYGCVAEEVADARLLSRTEVLAAIESLTYQFLQAISKGEDPELLLVRLLAAPLSFIPPPPPPSTSKLNSPITYYSPKVLMHVSTLTIVSLLMHRLVAQRRMLFVMQAATSIWARPRR